MDLLVGLNDPNGFRWYHYVCFNSLWRSLANSYQLLILTQDMSENHFNCSKLEVSHQDDFLMK